VEVLVQPIEECLKPLFRPEPIANWDCDMISEQTERYGIEPRVVFTALRPRPSGMFCVLAVGFDLAGSDRLEASHRR
jgi:hypothetical protein